MTSDEQTRRAIKELTSAGWVLVRSDGRHANYRCPCGQHQFPLPVTHKTVSAGVMDKMRKLIKTCKGG
jgi:predicted RNA binding protein YcfA (HicA-like mRNA interferase family)